MMRILLLVGLALALVTSLSAGSFTCSSGPTDGSLISVTCPSFSFNDYLDWGAAPITLPGAGQSGFGDNGTYSGPWIGQTLLGVGVGVSLVPGYNGGSELQRADNTVYYWGYNQTGSLGWTNWNIPVSTFAGHFGAPPTSAFPFGDRLFGDAGGSGSIAITFSQAVSAVGFRISDAVDANFLAYIYAFDQSNNLLGVSEINATGLGGTCAGLNNPGTPPYGDPVPCNDAATIGIGGYGATIGSIQVKVVSDDGGIWLDTLELGDVSPPPEGQVPEPGVLFLMGSGLGLILIARVRKTRLSR